MNSASRRKIPIPAHEVRQLSVKAPADPRSIRKFLLGGDVAPMTAERIRRAMTELGIAHLAPAPAPAGHTA